MSGPMDGDLVTGIEDRLDGGEVLGVLRLRYVPLLDYVQAVVETPEGAQFVDPGSVRVVRLAFDVVQDDDLNEPLRDDPGWRRVVSLDAARADGLLRRPLVPAGLRAADIEERLRRITAPLVTVGWRVVEFNHWTDPDEVTSHCELERAGTAIEVAYCCTDDDVKLWDATPSPDPDNPRPPLDHLSHPTDEECRDAFAAQGWLTELG